MLKNDFPAEFLPVDFGGEVQNDNSVKLTKLIKKAAPKIEKDYAYLKAGNKITPTKFTSQLFRFSYTQRSAVQFTKRSSILMKSNFATRTGPIQNLKMIPSVPIWRSYDWKSKRKVKKRMDCRQNFDYSLN